MFIGLLASIVNASNHTKCIFLYNQQCITQPTLTNFHPNEYGCNRVCFPNETEDLDLNVFNMITNINESRTLTKHISCE